MNASINTAALPAQCTHDCKQGDACTCAAHAIANCPQPQGAKPLRFAPGTIEHGKAGWSYSITVGDLILIAISMGSILISAGYIGSKLGWL